MGDGSVGGAAGTPGTKRAEAAVAEAAAMMRGVVGAAGGSGAAVPDATGATGAPLSSAPVTPTAPPPQAADRPAGGRGTRSQAEGGISPAEGATPDSDVNAFEAGVVPDRGVTPISGGLVEGDGGAPGGAELQRIQQAWAGLASSISSPVTRSMLTHALGPVALAGDLVRIEVGQPMMVNRLNDQRQRKTVGVALSKALGQPFQVEFVLVGSSPGASASTSTPASKGAADRPPSDAAPSNPTVSRDGSSVRPVEVNETAVGAPATDAGSLRRVGSLPKEPTPAEPPSVAAPASEPRVPPVASAPAPNPVTNTPAAAPINVPNPGAASAASVTDEEWLSGAPINLGIPGITPVNTGKLSPREQAKVNAAKQTQSEPQVTEPPEDYYEISEDDPEVMETGLQGVEAAIAILDGTVIEEIEDP